MDADGRVFAKVATEKLPRVYLLDPAGKVLWFDPNTPAYRTSLPRARSGAIVQATHQSRKLE